MPYECKLTIVNDGRSDSVIKIYPAKMPEGKVWLNRVAHKEWWERVKQNLNRYAAKGTYVPEPAPWHHDGNPLATIVLTEDKIPQVRLDGWELPELPPEDKTPILPNSSGNMLAIDSRISSLENRLDKVLSALEGKRPPEPQTQSDDLTSSGVADFECCGIKFKNGTGLSAHKRFKHKGVIAQIKDMVTGGQ